MTVNLHRPAHLLVLVAAGVALFAAYQWITLVQFNSQLALGLQQDATNATGNQ